MDSQLAHTVIPVRNGRFALPTGFKADDGVVVVTAGLPRCLLLFQTAEWMPIREKLFHVAEMDIKDGERQTKLLIRLVLGFARECRVNRRGDIGLAPELLQFARIGNELQWVPATKGIELWNPSDFSDGKRVDLFAKPQGPALPET